MDFSKHKQTIARLVEIGELIPQDGIEIMALIEIAETSPLSEAFKKPDFKPTSENEGDENMKING